MPQYVPFDRSSGLDETRLQPRQGGEESQRSGALRRVPDGREVANPGKDRTWQAEPSASFSGEAGFTVDAERELQFLKSRAEFLSQQLEAVRRRIEEIEK